MNGQKRNIPATSIGVALRSECDRIYKDEHFLMQKKEEQRISTAEVNKLYREREMTQQYEPRQRSELFFREMHIIALPYYSRERELAIEPPSLTESHKGYNPNQDFAGIFKYAGRPKEQFVKENKFRPTQTLPHLFTHVKSYMEIALDGKSYSHSTTQTVDNAAGSADSDEGMADYWSSTQAVSGSSGVSAESLKGWRSSRFPAEYKRCIDESKRQPDVVEGEPVTAADGSALLFEHGNMIERTYVATHYKIRDFPDESVQKRDFFSKADAESDETSRKISESPATESDDEEEEEEAEDEAGLSATVIAMKRAKAKAAKKKKGTAKEPKKTSTKSRKSKSQKTKKSADDEPAAAHPNSPAIFFFKPAFTYQHPAPGFRIEVQKQLDGRARVTYKKDRGGIRQTSVPGEYGSCFRTTWNWDYGHSLTRFFPASDGFRKTEAGVLEKRTDATGKSTNSTVVEIDSDSDNFSADRDDAASFFGSARETSASSGGSSRGARGEKRSAGSALNGGDGAGRGAKLARRKK